MTVKHIERRSGESWIDDTYLVDVDDREELLSEPEEETDGIWPVGFDEALPPAPGGCRHVSHDW